MILFSFGKLVSAEIGGSTTWYWHLCWCVEVFHLVYYALLYLPTCYLRHILHEDQVFLGNHHRHRLLPLLLTQLPQPSQHICPLSYRWYLLGHQRSGFLGRWQKCSLEGHLEDSKDDRRGQILPLEHNIRHSLPSLRSILNSKVLRYSGPPNYLHLSPSSKNYNWYVLYSQV